MVRAKKIRTLSDALQPPVKDILESDFRFMIIQVARMYGWEAYFTYDSTRSPAGFPDLVLGHPKRKLLIYRELKTQTKLSADQEKWRDIILAAGGNWAEWRPKHWPEILEILSGGKTPMSEDTNRGSALVFGVESQRDYKLVELLTKQRKKRNALWLAFVGLQSKEVHAQWRFMVQLCDDLRDTLNALGIETPPDGEKS